MGGNFHRAISCDICKVTLTMKDRLSLTQRVPFGTKQKGQSVTIHVQNCFQGSEQRVDHTMLSRVISCFAAHGSPKCTGYPHLRQQDKATSTSRRLRGSI